MADQYQGPVAGKLPGVTIISQKAIEIFPKMVDDSPSNSNNQIPGTPTSTPSRTTSPTPTSSPTSSPTTTSTQTPTQSSTPTPTQTPGSGGNVGNIGSSGGGSSVGSDPFVLDLDGDGVEMVDLKDSNAYFDFKGNGFATHTSWISSDDGILALDRNSNGKIDNINEIFGNATQTGFAALAELDTNSDGIINSNDEVYADLKVWQDSNGDGISQADELKTLDYFGIAGVSLSNTAVNQPSPGDGQITHTGTFNYTNGSTGTSADAVFMTDPVQTKYMGDVTITTDVAEVANIKGYGLMPDLQIAMSLDEGLKTAVMNGLSQLTVENANQTFEQILYKWAKAENITLQEIDPNASLSMDPETGLVFFQNAGVSFSLQQLGVIKQYSGLDVLSVSDGQWRLQEGVIVTTGEYYQSAWNTIYNNLLAKFAVTNGLVSGLLPGATYNMATDKLSVDFNIQENAQQFFDNLINNIIQHPQDATIVNQSLLSAMVLFEIDPASKTKFAAELDKSLTASNIADLNQVMESDLFQLLYLDSNDTLYGSANGDVINAGQGHNLVFGNEGNDIIYSGAGDDIIVGGAGSDQLFGGRGNDAYVFNLGDGEDTIYEAYHDYTSDQNASVNAGFDEISFGEGISTDNIHFSAEGNHLVISFTDHPGDKIILQDFANPANQIESFVFSDGSVWDIRTALSSIPTVEGNSNPAWVSAWLAENSSGNTLSSTGNDVLIGSTNGDTLSGGNGDDIIWGYDGDDEINGDNGNDLLLGGSGNDVLYGGLGQDVLVGEAGNDTLWGLAGNDVLYGGQGEDFLYGNLDDDQLFGGGGNDILDGGTGNDILYGDDGDDQLWANDGDDQVYGGIGNDLFGGGMGNDIMFGEEGDDTLWGNDGNDTLLGGSGYDVLCGDAGNDILYGEDNGDTLWGGEGNDKLYGGTGDDLLIGNNGNDILYGEDGDDTLWADDGEDQLYGGVGNDLLGGGNGNDIMHGDDGDDKLWGNDGDDQLHGGAGNDFLYGDAGNDLLIGNSGNDILYGEDGDDTLWADDGEDQLYGGVGNDLLGGGNGNDIMYGDDGDDQLWGNDNDDQLFGGAGNDILMGDAGNDVLNGGLGADQLFGGAGTDVFAFSTLEDSARSGMDTVMDMIVDFEEGQDKINVSALGFQESDFGQGLVFNTADGLTTVKDINSDFAFQLQGEHQLHATDFVFAA